MHAHAGTRVHEATSLTGLVPERVQLTVHTTEPTGTVPEPFHCDHIARWSDRSGTSGRSGTGLNTGNWNGSGTVLVSNLWCEHGLSTVPSGTISLHLRNLYQGWVTSCVKGISEIITVTYVAEGVNLL